jgi:hypothetical protein
LIVIDHVYVRRPPFDFSQTFGELACICRNFNVSEVCSDRYSIGALISECQRNGLTHKASDLDKSRLYLHSLPQLTSGRVRLPDVPEIVTEFCSLERRTGSEGRDKVDARGGKPEDIANAAAGCIWLLSQPMSGAENWIEFYRRQVECPSRFNTDMDDVRVSGPDFSFSFASEPLIAVLVPEPVASEGQMHVDGRQCVFRRNGTAAILEVRRAVALELLQRPLWRGVNADLVAKLEHEEAA